MPKCSKGFKSQGNKCVRYVTRNRYKDGLEKGNKIVRFFCLGVLILLGFLFAINLRNTDVLWALAINIFFVLVAFMSFGFKEMQEYDIDIPIEKKASKTFGNFGKVILWGVLFTIIFYLVTLFVPGFNLGYIQLPNDISASFKWFLINVMSPISESLFFLGTVYAFFNYLFKRHKFLALILASILFSSFHLSSYILGFYSYPEFTSAMTAFWANFSAFFTAFLFNMIAGSFMIIGTDSPSQSYRKNLLFGIVFHGGLNWIATSLSVIVFAFSIPFLIKLTALILGAI